MKIRFHFLLSSDDVDALQTGYSPQSDRVGVYIEVPDSDVKDVLERIEQHPGSHLQASFINGYYFVY